MKTTTFICDSCKQSVGESELFTLSVTIKIPKQKGRYTASVASCEKDMCRNCLEKKGLITEAFENGSDKEGFQQNQKTIESKLTEILEDLGVSFGE